MSRLCIAQYSLQSQRKTIYAGSSVPSAFLLFVMRELPPPVVINRQEESRTITFIASGSGETQYPQWTAAMSAQNQVL